MLQMEYKALVVHDEPAVCPLMVRALCDQGFQCDGARNGAEALEMAFADRYDAVVTDLRMPQLQGSTLAMVLLEQADRPAVVIIVEAADSRQMSDLIHRGIDSILFKPIDPKQLAASVRSIVDRRQSQRVGHARSLPAPPPGILNSSEIFISAYRPY